MNENKSDLNNPVLKFEGKKYLINTLSKDIKESIKALQSNKIDTYSLQEIHNY